MIITRNLPWTSREPEHSHTYVGETLSPSATYYQRDGARLKYMASLASFILLGGWHPTAEAPWAPKVTTNEVWSSPSSAPSLFTRHLTHVDTPPSTGAGARWTRRHTFPVDVHTGPDGAEAVYIVGSDLNDTDTTPNKPDVWKAVDPRNANGWTMLHDGVTDPPRPRSYDPICKSYRGELHVIGGFEMPSNNASSKHYSSADGVTWTRRPDLPFAVASGVAMVTSGLLVVLGGSKGNYAQYGVASTLSDEIWAFNGYVWKRISGGPQPYSGCIWVAGAAYDGRIWVGPRYTPASGNTGGLFASADLGASWTNMSEGAPWPISHADGWLATEEHGIIHASGNNVGQSVYRYRRST